VCVCVCVMWSSPVKTFSATRVSVLRLLSSSSACGYAVNRKRRWKKNDHRTQVPTYIYIIRVRHTCTSHGRDFVVILRAPDRGVAILISHMYTSTGILLFIIIIVLIWLLLYLFYWPVRENDRNTIMIV